MALRPNLRHAGWGSWRACLLWGLATLAVSQSFGLFMPSALAHPIRGASVENPVLAFEFARNSAHLDAVFGVPGDPLRDSRIAGMMQGNVLDYVFMVVYGSFVLAFFGATAWATGNDRWWLAGWLGPFAAVSDAIENVLLLSINYDMATPAPELTILPLPVWSKFIALAVACGCAALALARQRAWLPVLLCLPPAIVIWFGLAAPMRWGESAVGTIAVAWVTMLLWAAWRTCRPTAAHSSQ
ncbi:hypothetical protein ACWPM1_07375 [Tsuneonella sp. HG249]